MRTIICLHAPLREALARAPKLRTPSLAARKKGFLAASLFLMLLFFQTNALSAQADTLAMARLSIYSFEEGLSVLLNGNVIGKTPLRDFALPAGHYEIIVQAARAASWLDEDWCERVLLREADSLRLVARMMRGYRINSIPYGAEIWQQGKLLGTTPYVLRLPETESAPLEIRHPSYQTISFAVGRKDERGNEQRNYDLVLERNFAYAATQQRDRAEARARIAQHRKLAYLSAAVSFASGVGATLLKREADEAYEQYLVTGDAAAREAYFARAERYDRYYSAAFALFEVSFAVSFYGFLKALR